MKQQISGRTVAIVLLLVLGLVQFIYWRTLVYQPAGPAVGGPGPGGGGGAPALVAQGRPELSVTTLAGAPVPGYQDGRAGRARFDGPSAVTVDRDGNLFVADTRNHRIRQIAPDGRVTTVAGSGPTGELTGGYADGPADRGRFRCPAGLVVAGDGTLYVADTGNNCIRRIRDGTVSTLAGSGGAPGFADGAPGVARFDQPAALSLGRDGNLYVADTGNAAVRKVSPSGNVSTVARGGALKAPLAVVPAPDGSFIVSDPRAGRAFRIAGDGAGPEAIAFHGASEAAPLQPGGAATAPDGTLLFTDLGRHVLFGEYNGYAYVLAGVIESGEARTGHLDQTADRAAFHYPFGLAVADDGIIFVADFANHCVRRIGPDDDKLAVGS